MSAKTPNEDAYFEQQILEVNMLGNSLISGVVSEKIAENKKNIASKIFEMGDLCFYKAELEKLKSLKIVNIHKVLNTNELNDMSVQIKAADKLLTKMEEILNDHIKFDAKDVISTDELQNLKNNISILQSLKDKFLDVPNIACSKIEKVDEFSKDLKQVVDFIESSITVLNEDQINIIKNTSEMMNYC